MSSSMFPDSHTILLALAVGGSSLALFELYYARFYPKNNKAQPYYAETEPRRVALLKRQVQSLRGQLDAVIDEVEEEDRRLGLDRRGRLSSGYHVVTQSGEKLDVDVSSDELEAMRAIFDEMDEDGDGFISAIHLKKLHTRLGEPITDSEASEALAIMSGISSEDIGSAELPDYVDFMQFMAWWQIEHTGDTAVRSGESGSLEYRIHFRSISRGELISPWHDIPLRNEDHTYNCIIEIPKWSRKKYEIATGELYNPIKQDTKNGKLREYKYGDMLFNYGALPQTWEDPNHISPDTSAIGDNDPIDVVEIGSKRWQVGSIVRVKVLGVLALVDSGETDWKLVYIYASKLNDIDDVDIHLPGLLDALRKWLRWYKRPAENLFGLGGNYQNRKYAENIVQETHEFWKKLVAEYGKKATV